jgi:hypothetical protein
MDANEIEHYLAELGDELRQRGLTQPLRILVVGGAFMLTQIHNRSATQDIDVLLEDIADPATDPRYPIFMAAKRAVATLEQLSPKWINDVVGDALRLNGPVPPNPLADVCYGRRVYAAPDYVLALKLFAGREKDHDDCVALAQQLGIVSQQQAQALVDRYIPDRAIQMQNKIMYPQH